MQMCEREKNTHINKQEVFVVESFLFVPPIPAPIFLSHPCRTSHPSRPSNLGVQTPPSIWRAASDIGLLLCLIRLACFLHTSLKNPSTICRSLSGPRGLKASKNSQKILPGRPGPWVFCRPGPQGFLSYCIS